MGLKQSLSRYFDIAFRPTKVGFVYDVETPTEAPTKFIVECLTAVLVLYASYSELTEKILKTFSPDQSYSASIGARIITCGFGIFVCVHIIFATKTGQAKTFAYTRLQRWLARGTLVFVVGSLGWIGWDYFHQPPTTLGEIGSYYEVPPSEWSQTRSPQTASTMRTYVWRVELLKEVRKRHQNLRVSVEPAKGFALKSSAALPKESKAIPTIQEPMLSESGPGRWTWAFAEFDPSLEWRIEVQVEPSTSNVRFTDGQLPLKATVYLHK